MGQQSWRQTNGIQDDQRFHVTFSLAFRTVLVSVSGNVTLIPGRLNVPHEDSSEPEQAWEAFSELGASSMDFEAQHRKLIPSLTRRPLTRTPLTRTTRADGP
jgi:hypothetical protein